MFKFGVTTRITSATSYDEPRDSLAHDWGSFFKREFPNNLWVAIPNLGEDAVHYFRSHSLNVLILSGGDSIGVTPIRDKTEIALLDYALKNEIPVIAICRGMQLIHSYFGGKITTGDEKFISIHRTKQHNVITEEGNVVCLNSYHNNVIVEKTIHKSLSIIARCELDNSVEAFRRKGLIGMMWHPEREMKDYNWSTNILRTFLQNK